MTRAGLAGATLAIALGIGAAGSVRAQTIDTLPAPGATAPPSAEATPWEVEYVDAPDEIAIGTMAIRLWASVRPSAAEPAGWGATLVVRDGEEEERIPVDAVDGAFDAAAEEIAATVDTYTWVREGKRTWELWSRPAHAAPRKLREGVVRVVSRVRLPDLVVVDELGRATPWIGGGAGGFVPGPSLPCGPPLGVPRAVDVSGDRRDDVLVSARDGAVHVLKATRSGILEEVRRLGCGAGLAAAAFGDLDGDGGVDLVTARSPRLLQIRSDLDDVPTDEVDLPLEVEHLALADLDGDGREEIYLALLGLAEEQIVRWSKNGDDGWGPGPPLSPGDGGRGRLRGLIPLTDRAGPARALLAISTVDGEGVLESWSGAADIEAVDHPHATRAWRVAGEPLGAVSGRFSDSGEPSWLVWIRREGGVEWLEVPRSGPVRSRGWMDAVPAAACALDLDGDGDDDLATGGEELRLWINVRGRDFREAGDSPYPLEARVLALAAGRLDE